MSWSALLSMKYSLCIVPSPVLTLREGVKIFKCFNFLWFLLIFDTLDMNRSKLLNKNETDYNSTSGYVETSLSEDQFYLTPDVKN